MRRHALWIACGMLMALVAPAQTAPAPARAEASHRASRPDSPLVRNTRFHSAALNREMRYRIYLPHRYSATAERYPVLYLLHGLSGNYRNWDTLTNLKSYAAGMDWIIVMPDADDSWYTNSATKPQDKFEDYIAKDLIAEIDGKYRTIREGRGRAIAGLSMGGYGALKFALRDPQSFAFAGSLSGALDAARDLDTRVSEFAPKLAEIFGPPANASRAQNDIFVLLQKDDPEKLPYLYLACGTDDRFLSINREFAAALAQRHVRYEYHETPGNHEWPYWDREIRPMLQAMRARVSSRGR